MPGTHAPHTGKCMAVRSTGHHDHCFSANTGAPQQNQGVDWTQRKRNVNGPRRGDEKGNPLHDGPRPGGSVHLLHRPSPGLRSCTLSTLRPWGSQSWSSNFAYIQTYLCSWHPHALKWTGEGVIIIKLSRRLAHAWGAGSIPSLKYAGYAGVDTAHLNACISKLFLRGSTSSESVPPSQQG